ncbi:MAG: 2-amino-4-hydroxy-6-hydroxymethyldihydropteridine diphosphokinase [Candidatus Marinimicrobia bacterium]|nr:2-amino-4-hydroxy-6-hydroxymethyldihydropteridine diphosphokinase [Candidatus Neomarinimicrobiota bacterium]MDD5583087.1 2-amino-4-hydroxy-6-hydroxymethyldihydropteridine diphosphokinase [Candidatus Neomarinimicrobiota bacterium]
MKQTRTPVYLGFGGNVGNVKETLINAIHDLDVYKNISFIQKSSFYKTQPLYNISQPDFINLVAEFSVGISPFELLKIIQEIEKKYGRKRESTRRYEPRTLDIDILFWNQSIVREKELVIPHLGFSERKFVLEPMSEIALYYCVPGTDKTIQDFLRECPDHSRVEKL